mgnify:CR=1 FL=1
MLTMPKLLILPGALILTACVSVPTGPSIMTLPGSGKNFDQFRSDENQCRQYAHQEIGGETARQAAASSGFQSAAIGAGLGAAVGAGMGLLAGGLSGSETAKASGHLSQQRYDNSYIQCMYAHGHRVPVSDGTASNTHNQAQNVSSQSTEYTAPPPPPTR